MTKQDKESKKVPYSISFSKKFIKNLRYYKRTNPDVDVDQQIEKLLSATMIPDRNDSDE